MKNMWKLGFVVTMVFAVNGVARAALLVTSDNQVLDGVALGVGEDVDIISGGAAWNVTFKNMTFDTSNIMQDGTRYGNSGLGNLSFENCTFTNQDRWDSLYLTVKRGEIINSTFSNITAATFTFLGTQADPVDVVLGGNNWNSTGSWGAFEVSGHVNSVSITDNTFSGLGPTTYMGHALHLWSQSPYTLEMTGNDFTDGGAAWFLSNQGRDAAANGGTATDVPLYIPNVTFSGNTSDSGDATIDLAGWYYTSPTYADLRYTQNDKPAATAAAQAGLTDYLYDAANIATWDITGQSNFETTFLLRDRTINGTSPRVEGDIVFIIPEPATMSLLGLGGLVMLRRRR